MGYDFSRPMPILNWAAGLHPGGAMAITPDQPTELELLHRLMGSNPFIRVEMAIELVVGDLPAAFADEVPLPSGARLVGSVLTSHQGVSPTCMWCWMRQEPPPRC